LVRKNFYGVKILDKNSEKIHEKQEFIIQKTQQLCKKVGLNTTQIGIYQSSEINAFATGPSNSKSLIAYSTGLLDHMNEEEIEGVIAHEIGHIVSGDMMTMTLLQGLMNAFVMFAARALATVIDNYLDDEDTGFGGLSIWGYWILVWVLEIIFMIFAYMLISWFSRKREYKADEYSANLVGRDKMIASLNSLKNIGSVETSEKEQRDSLVFSKINNTKKKIYFFETHPDLDDRINNLNI
jgi:heat shock protein HtpX